MAKDLYSTFQAAKILGVTPDTVLKWIKRGKIAASRTLGGHYRIPKEKIDELLSEREIHSSTTGTPSSCKAFQYRTTTRSLSTWMLPTTKTIVPYLGEWEQKWAQVTQPRLE
jgi:excisionase family DNA binding protein